MDGQVDGVWNESLRQIMREVILALPENTTLGDLIDAARKHPQMSPALNLTSVQELIDLAVTRPVYAPEPEEPSPDDTSVYFDEDGNPVIDLDTGPKVIRRRADVPGGDLLILKALTRQKTGRRESDLLQITGMTSEQQRLVCRHLKTRGLIHIEGAGPKRRFKITRAGSSFLRRQNRRH
ncbi:MAG: hypothetical protein ACPG4T_01200 [Nannocystaceae bacterium]